ncbi:MAG: class I SAM-dependent methyltransferase [Fibrobacter sp.]|nr:class I SAM-dependent methyltransferase [Fibrobacter sp.]
MKLKLLIRTKFKDFYLFLRSQPHRGRNVYCPICGFRASKFGSSPNGLRENVKCPRCSSLERHRAQWLFGLSKAVHSIKSKNLRILHFSPEFCFSRVLLSSSYFTAEHSKNSCSDYIIDIQYTGLPDSSFDIIICNHILEHVEDDRRAIRELYRLLKPEGVAFIQVPMDVELKKTIEDPSVTDPNDRERLFGQPDHLRMYGSDFPERLSDNGFKVDSVFFWESMDPLEIARLSLYEKEPVYICKK